MNPQNQSQQNQNIIIQNNSSLNEIYYSLQNDFKNIQIELEEKTKTNKKLLEDFTHLLFYLEKEVEYVEKLRKEKDIYAESNQDLNNEQKNFNQNMLALNHSKNECLKQLYFLKNQNNIINQQIEEEQNEIQLLEQERLKYNSLNKEIQIKNNEKINKIKINDDAIDYFQQQLNNSSITINKMVNMISELEKYYKNLQNEYEEYNAKHKIYENKKFNNDKIYQELMDNIKKKESDINDNMNKLDSISGEKEELYNYNIKIYNDLDRLQNHIYELAEQNKKLLEKIEKNQKIEEMINNHIVSKKNMNDKLNEQQQFIEKKIGNELKNYSQYDNELENKSIINKSIKDKMLDSIQNNKIIIEKNNINNELINERLSENKNSNSNAQYLDERKSSSTRENKSLNTLNYNRNGDLTLDQNDNNITDKNFSNLFDKQSFKNIETDYNYMDSQRELELEHDYD